MRKVLAAAAIAMAVAVPFGAGAHEPYTAIQCVEGPDSKDCARLDTDTELESGAQLTVDGDDTDPRGDDTSDGYVSVQITREGEVTVYCEDEGGYNYADTEEDDHNGTNEECHA